MSSCSDYLTISVCAWSCRTAIIFTCGGRRDDKFNAVGYEGVFKNGRFIGGILAVRCDISKRGTKRFAAALSVWGTLVTDTVLTMSPNSN